MKIFLSVGRTYNDDGRQEAFVRYLESFLERNGCERLTAGRGSYSSKQPVVYAKELMGEADGVIVVAFTRLIIERAIEKPCSEQEIVIERRKLTTIWNQLEAAMAFGLGLPLLILMEEGVHQEAMLKDRLEYRLLTMRVDPESLKSEEFVGVFKDWKRRCEEHARTRKASLDATQLSVSQLVGSLTAPQLWGGLITSITALSSVAAAAFWFGQRVGP